MTDKIEQIDKQIVQTNRRLETHEIKKRELKHDLISIKNKLHSANTYGSKDKLKDKYNHEIIVKTNEIGKVDADILLEHHRLRELQREKQGTINQLRKLAVMPTHPKTPSPPKRQSPQRKTRSRSRSPKKRQYDVPDIEEDLDLMAELEDISGGKRRRKKKTRRRKSKKCVSLF
jgi:hypothetical protein